MHIHDIFVGRQRELEQLGSALHFALGGRGALVLVVGEPGVGKTRLVQEFAGQAVSYGVCTLWGSCRQERGMPPYWPWIEVIRSYVRERTAPHLRAVMGAAAADIAQMVPELRQKLPDLESRLPLRDPDAARFRFFDSVAQFFKSASAQQPILLVLDDIHWADRSSLLLLEFLSHEVARTRALVVSTYRDTELQPLGPLAQALGEISRQGVFARFQLKGLSLLDVGAYVKAASGHRPPEPLVRAIYAHTEGNPLFVSETVRQLAEEGRLGPSGWRMPGERWQMEVPEGVRQVIGRRLSQLSLDCISLLATAAAIGRDFGLWELQALVGETPPNRLGEALEEALAARIIEELPGRAGHYQFSHPLIRETLYDDLASPRRLRLHRRIGEVLESLYGGDADPPVDRLAHHFAQAGPVGDAAKAIRYAQQAAARATAVLAYDESAHYYRMALEAWERKQPRDETERRRLLLALGESYRRAGATPEALRIFEQAARLAREAQAPEDLARAALGMEDTTWRPGLSGELGARYLRHALELAGEEQLALRARLSASLARALVYAGEVDRGLALAREAVEMARRTGDPEILAAALRVGLSARWRPETVRERLAAAGEMAALAEEAGDRDLALEAYSWRLFDLLEIGEIGEVDRQILAHARQATELRQPFYLFVNATFQAARATWEGRFQEAEKLTREALAIGQRFRGLDASGIYGMQMFTLRRAQGRLREMEPAVRSFVRRYSEAAAWRPGLALIYSDLGLVREARNEFEQLAEADFAAVPRDGLWLACVVYLSEVCTFLGDCARAATLRGFLLPYAGHNVVVGPAVACYGSASHYLGLLATTMGRWQEAEALFREALAMNERIRARPWLAQTQHAYAEMLLQRAGRGDRARARALLTGALATARDLGLHALTERIAARLEARPPAIPAAPEQVEQLTPREVEVLRLLAGGRSNREIAAALVISVHTVANHVKNLLGKTQTANRTELAAYAHRHGLLRP